MPLSEFSRFIVDQTFGALSDAANMFTQRDPEFIKSGTPQSMPGKVVQGAARQACRRFADDPSSVRPYARWKAEASCRPYLDDIGYGGAGKVDQPYSGGQCAAVYRANGVIEYDRFFCSTGQIVRVTDPFATEFNITGPISNVRIIQNTPGQCGNRFLGVAITTPSQPERFIFNTLDVNTRSLRNPSIVSLSFQRSGGLPDDCGSPPPILTDPTPPPTPGPRFERYNPDPDTDIDIGIDINPDGTIDIDFGTGPITIDPWGEPSSGGGSAGPAPGDLGEPGAPADTGEAGDADGEAPPDTVLTALKINFVSPPVGRTEYAPGVFRGVCYIYMGNSDGVDHDPAGAMLRDGQLVLAEKDNLTNWFVSANKGYNLRVTPYYREVET